MLPPLAEIHSGILEVTTGIATLMFCIALLILKWRYLRHLLSGSKKRKGKGKRKRKRVTNNFQINVAVMPPRGERDDPKLPSPAEQSRLDENRRGISLHE